MIPMVSLEELAANTSMPSHGIPLVVGTHSKSTGLINLIFREVILIYFMCYIICIILMVVYNSSHLGGREDMTTSW